MYHCFFEQSGTFKNEFKKLGYEAEDYDILNDFGETDHIIDLFGEIRRAYEQKASIFDKIIGGGIDTIIAFFPCIRFEAQIIMNFRGVASQMKNYTDEQKLEYDLKLHKELAELYELITKLALVCIRRNIPLIIENPMGEQHYLTRYWGIKAKVFDKDRTKRGDFYVKPTQYFFIGREPSRNMIFEPEVWNERKRIAKINNKVERSMISKEYASRFIKEFII